MNIWVWLALVTSGFGVVFIALRVLMKSDHFLIPAGITWCVSGAFWVRYSIAWIPDTWYQQLLKLQAWEPASLWSLVVGTSLLWAGLLYWDSWVNWVEESYKSLVMFPLLCLILGGWLQLGWWLVH